MLSVLNKVHFFDPQTKTWLPVDIPVQPNKIRSAGDVSPRQLVPLEGLSYVHQDLQQHGIVQRSWNPMDSLIPSYREIMRK